jgi:hypothetical protein
MESHQLSQSYLIKTMSNSNTTITIHEDVKEALSDEKGNFETWNAMLLRLAEGAEGE